MSGARNRYGLLAGLAALLMIVATGGTPPEGAKAATGVGVVGQQSGPDAPTILSLVGGHESISINWGKPSSINAADIVALEVRHILSSATDKADSNWTVTRFDSKVNNSRLAIGLTTILRGLANGSEYDVQIRLEVGSYSDWSATSQATPKSPGDNPDPQAAISLPGNIAVIGHLNVPRDADYFRFTISKKSEVILFSAGPNLDNDGKLTSGTVNAQGELFLDRGSQNQPQHIDSVSPGGVKHGNNNFLIAETLDAGTYFLDVNSPDDNIGAYTLYYRAYPETTGTGDARELLPDSSTNGVTETIANPGTIAECSTYPTAEYPRVSTDVDYFKFELEADASVHIYARAAYDSHFSLYAENQTTVAYNDNGLLGDNPDIVKTLDAGIYFLALGSIGCEAGGFYSVSLRLIGSPGTSKADATELDIFGTAAGEFTTSSNEHFYSLSLTEERFVYFNLFSSNTAKPDVRMIVLDNHGVPQEDFSLPAFDNDAFANVEMPEMFASYEGLLVAGDYTIWLHAPTQAGPYALGVISHPKDEDSYWDFRASCDSKEDTRPTAPSDEFYGCQWHLNNTGQFVPPNRNYPREDINIEEVWEEGITGEGVNISIIDLGLNSNHIDYRDSVLADKNLNFIDSSRDIGNPWGHHGTHVAGIIAANHNDIGTRGIAPDASIYGGNMLDAADQTVAKRVEALKLHARETAAQNNSWSITHGGKYLPAEQAWITALEEVLTEGFYGKGTSVVFAAGNSYDDNRYETNLYGHVNHWGTIPVCAIGLDDQQSDYSNIGATLWVCAPSDTRRIESGRFLELMELEGLPTTSGGTRYTLFGGTSASAPIVSGVIGLLRQVNEHLDWRDIKLILAGSARKNHASDSGWLEAGAKYGEPSENYNFNEKYGFGAVDVGAAVGLAKNWKTVPEYLEATATSSMSSPVTLANSATSFSSNKVSISSEMNFTEFVRVDVDFQHQTPRDLSFQLVSPSGNVTELTKAYYNQYLTQNPIDGVFRFGSSRHLGEDPDGEWTLRVKDDESRNPGGLWRSWTLTVYGHGDSPQITGPSSIQYATFGSDFVSPYAVATYSATDPHNTNAVLFALAGEDKDLFTLNASTGILAFNQAPTYQQDRKYHLKILATDGNHVGARYVSIGFVNRPPVISPTTAQVSYNENDSGAVASFSASDPEGDAVTLHLEGDDSDKFNLSGGVINFVAPPDYEAPSDSDQDNRYEITIHASDGNSEATHDVVVEVQNVDEAGSVSLSATQPSVGVQLAATLSDPDGTTSAATWKWHIRNGTESCTNGSASWELIAGANTNKYQPALGDVNCLLRASVAYADPEGSSKNAEATTAQPVATAGNAPTFPAVGNNANRYRRSVDENTAAGENIGQPVTASDADDGDVLRYSLVGASASSFFIVAATGQLQTQAALNYEATSRYTVTVEATDSFGYTASQGVTINIIDVDEPPSITSQKARIDLANGEKLTARYQATDPEGRSISWSITGADAAIFRIDPDGNLSFINVDFAAGNFGTGPARTYSITIVASDPAGNPDTVDVVITTPANVVLSASTTTTLPPTTTTTTVPPPTTTRVSSQPRQTIPIASLTANEAPTFDEPAPLRRSVVENAPLGTLVGNPITASDEEGDEIRYSLAGDHLELFEVDPASGQIAVKAGTSLDFETQSSYTIIVVASDLDGSGESTEVEVIVDVEDEAVVGPAASYDANRNERIELAELLEAFRDHLRKRLTLPQIIAVIRYYLST